MIKVAERDFVSVQERLPSHIEIARADSFCFFDVNCYGSFAISRSKELVTAYMR
jgi:hypothetical protein